MVEIFGTLGPSCQKTGLLEEMFREGMTGMRLNMSHSGLKESGEIIRNYQYAAGLAGVEPELLIDMQGPEIRIGELERALKLRNFDEAELIGCEEETKRPGQKERTEPAGRKGGPAQTDRACTSAMIPVPAQVFAILEEGDHVLLDDGRIELVVETAGQRTSARVIRGGILKSRKSLKVVDKYMTGPAVTRQDRENIRLAEEYGVTALMQPFVTRGEELLEVREELAKNHMEHIRVFAKIENREGMKHIHDIMPCADMIVIARGDLGNDMPLWELPAAQKELSEICKTAGKPFLVVTQMLASMIENPIPTRAEVSDIFHAVCGGAAAVMVTNETAAGKYPAEVIRYLKRTAEEAVKWRETQGKG